MAQAYLKDTNITHSELLSLRKEEVNQKAGKLNKKLMKANNNNSIMQKYKIEKLKQKKRVCYDTP